MLSIVGTNEVQQPLTILLVRNVTNLHLFPELLELIFLADLIIKLQFHLNLIINKCYLQVVMDALKCLLREKSQT